MSLIIASVACDRALVGVDTLAGSTDGGPVVLAEKLMVLPAHGCVLALRGVGQLLQTAVLVLSFRPQASDFDAIRALLPDVLLDAITMLRAEVKLGDAHDDFLCRTAHELFAVGWSTREGRMVGVTYRFDPAVYKLSPASAAFVPIPMDDAWRVHGAEADWPDFPVTAIDTPADLETVARWQVQHWRAREPNPRLGGRLLIAEVTRGRTTVAAHCAL